VTSQFGAKKKKWRRRFEAFLSGAQAQHGSLCFIAPDAAAHFFFDFFRAASGSFSAPDFCPDRDLSCGIISLTCRNTDSPETKKMTLGDFSESDFAKYVVPTSLCHFTECFSFTQQVMNK
jgi:hypothetical protein